MTDRRARGFSLLEAAIAIAILGLVGAVVAVFLRGPAEGYFDTARRAVLVETADNAIRRLARDVQAALPNSVRPGPSNQCFEFLPLRGGGRYRSEPTTAGGGDVLDFTVADSAFDVLAEAALPNFGASPSGTYQAVVYNLGIPGADAYAGDNRAGIASSSSASLFNLAAAKQFPFTSPARRVQVVDNLAVVYSCASGALLRSTRAITAAALATCPATGTALATNVSTCAFDYTAAVNTRFGVLAVTLGLSSGVETVQLYHEIHVDNVP